MIICIPQPRLVINSSVLSGKMWHFQCLLSPLVLLIFVHFASAGYSDCGIIGLSDCGCDYQNTLLDIKCTGISFQTVKSSLIADNSHDTVWRLIMYSTGDSILPENFLQNFTALSEFEVKFTNTLTSIEPGAFNGASNLEIITLSSSKIDWLSGAMFNGVTTNLQEIDLSGNTIEFLYYDMEQVFLKVSTHISLLSNSLRCTCQLKWLSDLLKSDEDLPEFSGTFCTDMNNNLISLLSPDTSFTDCPDVCSEGFHNCAGNEICTIDSVTQSFICSTPSSSSFMFESISSTSTSPLPPPSLSSIQVLSSTFDSVSSQLVTYESSPFVTSSQTLISSVYSTPLQTSSSAVLTSLLIPSDISISSSSSSLDITPSFSSSIIPTTSNIVTVSSSYGNTIETTVTTINPSSTTTPSPSSIVAPPEECGVELCQVTQSCSSVCECFVCMCSEGLSQSGDQPGDCVVPSFGQNVCDNDGFIGLKWPSAIPESTVSIPCCSVGDKCTAMATRTCTMQGEWSNFIGDNCVSASIYALQDLFESAKEGNSDILQNLTSMLYMQSSNQLLLSEDIVFLSDQITQTISLVNNVTDPQVISNIVDSISNLLNDDLLHLWHEQETPSAIITQLFQAVETLGTNFPISNGTVIIQSNNLALQVIIPDSTQMGWNISSTLLNGTNVQGHSSIFLPDSLLWDALGGQDLGNCDVRVIASLWNVDPSLLEVNNSAIIDNNEEELVYGMCDWSGGMTSSSSVLLVNSIIISATLYSPNCTLNTTDLSKPVQITLHHVNQSLDDPTCSFLDDKSSSSSDWIGGGCRVQQSGSTENRTVCECFHLTSFALLMSPTGSVSISKSLNIATKVGLSISILALIVTCILLFTLKLETKLNIVHRQLALALCLSQIVFLVGVDRLLIPYPDAACTIIAALLHYLLLCTFAWELIEGIHLYLFIVKVFLNTKKIIWSYYPMAWGVPLIIVGITLGVNFCQYGSRNFCWITTQQGTNWAFHGPVILVVVVNIIVLIIITVVVIKSARQKDPESCGFCKLLQASFVLVPTLGLTWTLGFFVVSDGIYATVVEWIFLVCTTLQGLFIFTIHCVLNTEVRASFLKALGFRQAASKQKSVFAFRPNMGAINSFAATGFRRLSLGGGSRRGSLEPFSDNSGLPNPQDLKDLQARLGIPLATVNEEDDYSEELETEINNQLLDVEGFNEISRSSDRLVPLVEDNTVSEPFQFWDSNERRSSTDGLLEEEKQGLYQIETGQYDDLLDGRSLHSNTCSENMHTVATTEKDDIIPVVEREERIELVGFSLGLNIDRVTSRIDLCDDTDILVTKSLSDLLQDNVCNNVHHNGLLSRWHSDSDSKMLNDSLKRNVLQSTMEENDSLESSTDKMEFDTSLLDKGKSMENGLVDRVNSADDILKNELQTTPSQTNMFY